MPSFFQGSQDDFLSFSRNWFLKIESFDLKLLFLMWTSKACFGSHKQNSGCVSLCLPTTTIPILLKEDRSDQELGVYYEERKRGLQR